MEFKKIELTLPPLGQFLLGKDEEGDTQIGFFYIDEDERCFKASGFSNGFCYIEPKSWTLLPEFKLIENHPIPIGKVVVVSYRNGTNDDLCFRKYIGILEHKNTHVNDDAILSWIYPEELNEK